MRSWASTFVIASLVLVFRFAFSIIQGSRRAAPKRGISGNEASSLGMRLATQDEASSLGIYLVAWERGRSGNEASSLGTKLHLLLSIFSASCLCVLVLQADEVKGHDVDLVGLVSCEVRLCGAPSTLHMNKMEGCT